MIICICARGNVRSATAAMVLREFFGVSDVFAIGVETMSAGFLHRVGKGEETRIILVGENKLAERFDAAYPELSRSHLDIGPDYWMMPAHPDLVTKLIAGLSEMGFAPTGANGTNWHGADPQTYIAAHTAAWNRHHVMAAT